MNAGRIAVGYAILLTNDAGYWNRTDRSTVDEMFRLHDNRSLQGGFRWDAATGKGTMKGREEILNLRNSYTVRWADYSQVNGHGPRRFRYLLLPVTRQTPFESPQ